MYSILMFDYLHISIFLPPASARVSGIGRGSSCDRVHRDLFGQHCSRHEHQGGRWLTSEGQKISGCNPPNSYDPAMNWSLDEFEK